MEPRPLSPWFGRIALLGIYLIWVGAMLQAGRMETRWAGITAGTLLVLIWLPYDVFRKRHEWLVWLPMHITIVIAVAVTITLMAEDKGVGREPQAWLRPLHGDLGVIFWTIHQFTDGIMERRAAERMKAFIEERRSALKKKPVARFAGRPDAVK